MTDLRIKLPKIDKNWIKDNTSQLLADGVNYLHETFDEIENITDFDKEDFYLRSNDDFEAELKSKSDIVSIFENYNLLNKQISTANDIATYNKALEVIIFQIASNYAKQWTLYIKYVKNHPRNKND